MFIKMLILVVLSIWVIFHKAWSVWWCFVFLFLFLHYGGSVLSLLKYYLHSIFIALVLWPKSSWPYWCRCFSDSVFQSSVCFFLLIMCCLNYCSFYSKYWSWVLRVFQLYSYSVLYYLCWVFYFSGKL